MYKSFNVDLSPITLMNFLNDKRKGEIENKVRNKLRIENYSKQVVSEFKQQIDSELEKYLGVDGSLSASKMESDWFPMTNADIFLSHSHKDEALAIDLAAWLYQEFRLKTFIDSTIWGNSSELLRKIDDKYCKLSDGETYSYSMRNQSTTYVHLILATALTKMMDKTECLFFLNTPSSLSISSVDNKEKTNSAWIYHELSSSKTLRINPPTRIGRIVESVTFDSTEKRADYVPITFEVPLDHLTPLGVQEMKEWVSQKSYGGSAVNKLDILYKLTQGK